jgi:DNA-directed RNA polymerase subunit RPC12/RpoP
MSESSAHDFREFAAVTPVPEAGGSMEQGSPLPQESTRYRCRECGRDFDNANALNGHMKSHRQKKALCPECGKLYVEGTGLAVHRRSQHGVESERQKRANGAKPKQTKPRVACEVCGEVMRKDNLARHMATKHAQVSVQAEEWSVEDIFDTVVSMLWPTGHMPVKAMNPLIIWREATAKMLIEVGRE